MRTKAKVDSNQPEIVAAFRKLGCTVTPTHMVGKGFPDIVVGKHGLTVLVEIKDGSKPPSARKLTPAEKTWHDGWSGWAEIVETDADVLRIDAELGVMARIISGHGDAP